ncbi:MAG: hypothetical protein HY898_33940 [Deltaproteobacteria bacterium]|nr:hypothetical protein [Deltaproteobacteria bacterium]
MTKATPENPSPPRRLRDLRDDRGGAVMVIAVFMAAFLVGALWYIIGFGDALLYRERMQDGADAVAFAAAVYHARGMNIIAMINLIMAAILAVLVALKICQILLIITNIISCIICALPYGVGVWACPICTASSTAENYVQKAIDAVQKFCDITLPILSKTQVVVSVTMPWIAEARAVSVAKSYSKPVEGGVILSSSLVPSSDRLGLPVQEDTYKELCRRAGMVVGEVVMAPFKVFGVDTRWASGLVGSLVSSFPGYFCGDSGGGGGSYGSGVDLGGTTAQGVCDAKKKVWDDKYKGHKKFDYDKCMEDEKKNANKQLGKNKQSQSSSGNNKTPKKVYEGAKNGNEYFQIWSVVWGDQARLKEGGQGVGIAAWNKAKPKPPPEWGKIGIAQAEFYYDGSGSWNGLKEDAMWNMRWRARLRRVRPPGQLGAALNVVSAIAAMAGSLGIGDPSQLIDGSVLGGGGWGDLFDGSAWIGKLKGEISDGAQSGAVTLPSGYTMIPGFWGAELIH